VIGKIGSREDGSLDLAGTAAVDALIEAGIEPLLAHDRKVGTGRSMICYLPNDHRLMVSDAGANATFSIDDIDHLMLSAVTRPGLVHVSGYALVQQSRRKATQKLIMAAQSAGATVAIDIVPHDIDRFVSPTAIREVLTSADWIITAKSTARRLLGADPVAEEETLLNGLATLANSIALFPHPSEAVVAKERKRWRHKIDYVPGASSRGQSARAQASLLSYYLLSPARHDEVCDDI
jgi:sugar/nucleoside kinase (ribokinase family)